MATKLSMAHERRKIQLRANILSSRVRIAQAKEQMKRYRDELGSMTGKKTKGGASSSAPFVKIGGR